MSKPRAILCLAILILAAGAGNLSAATRVQIVSDLGETVAAFSATQAGNSSVLSLSIPALEITDVSIGDGEYKQLALPAAEKLTPAESAIPGEPELPILTTLIAISDQGGVALSVEYSGFDIIDNIDVAPAQESAIEGQDQSDVPFSKNEIIYSQDKFFPENLAQAAEPAIMRDLRLVQITLSPVQYNPVRRQLRVYRDLSVRVDPTAEGANPKTSRRPFLSEAFLPLYKSLVSNFDEVFSSAETQRGGYLIIAKQMFVDSLKTLALWKHRKGYTVRVVPTTEIAPGGSPSTTQIYNFLRNAYTTWEIPPEYVMIVGDKDNTGQTGIPDYPYSSYTSDHQYSTVEGTDYLPDMAVVRFSVDNMSQFRVALAKLMAYETQPYMTDTSYWLRGLSVAGNVYAVTPRITVLWVRQLLLENGFTQVDTSFRWASGESDPRISTFLNAGVSMVSYRGWAGSSGWYSPDYSNTNLNALTNNNKLGVMASIVCGTGDFGDECFGETWIRMGASPTSFKGGPAFMGSTDHNTHTRWNNPIMVGYYWSIFKENNDHFGIAALRGKLQQYNTFPRFNGDGGTIEQYFNTYNMLGDPELEVRTQIPILISITHPATLPLGVNHIEINVTDTLDNPISNAYVTLNKGYSPTEEVFEIGRTDSSGDVSLSFSASIPDTMFVTVSGRNLYPYRGNLMIVQADLAVGYDSLTIDDDNSGYSSGNDDGLVNPNETIELGITLKNFGSETTARGITAVLESLDPELVTVHDASRNYGDLAPGQLGEPENPFVVSISKLAIDGDLARVKLSVTDNSEDSWYSVIELPVRSPKFIVTGVTFTDNNNRLDPGDSLSMTLTLKNQGTEATDAVIARLVTFDDYTTIIDGNGEFGHIGIDSASNNAADPMILRLDSGAFDGRVINLMLETTSSTGAVSSVPFTVNVGSITTTDPVGPDAYGYYMYDNTDTSYACRPAYEWIEINPNSGGEGTRLIYGSNTDDKSVLITMPFDFIYYGQSYNYMIVSTNGFTAFDSSRFDMAGNFWYNFFNWPIPDPGNAQGQISPFWDDLRFTGSNYGVYTWHDLINQRFVIEWSHLTNVNGGQVETFEMIIMDPSFHSTVTGDVEFYFLYNTIYNNGDSEENYASVGFESPSETMGLEYTYDSDYTPGAATLAAGRVIRITTNTGRGGISGSVDLIGNDSNAGAMISLSTGQTRVSPVSGDYWFKNVPPGSVTLSAEANGYFPVTYPNTVNVIENQTIRAIDFQMPACPIPDSLSASDNFDDRIEIRWNAIDHDSLRGYNIYRADWENGEYTRLNTVPLQLTQYLDSSAPDSSVVWYKVTAVYGDDNWSAESFASNIDPGSRNLPSSVSEIPQIPVSFFVSQNYPNPFNPTTLISFGIPRDSEVKVEIFNLLGQRVRTLLREQEKAGYKTVIWDGKDDAGKGVTSGVYFYRVDAGSFHDTKKMTLLR